MYKLPRVLGWHSPLSHSPCLQSLTRIASGRRLFHASQRRRSSVLDGCCTHAFGLIDSIHSSTGLSWVYVLPLTAFLLRITLVTPLNVWARINMQRLIEMRPLAFAWIPVIRKRVLKENVQLGPVACQKLANLAIHEKHAQLRKTFGVYRSAAFAPLLHLPIFLLAIETIRRMGGAQSGLLGLIAEKLFGEEQTSAVPVQASLASEGALWFPDLLVPDPHLILPLVLSGVLFANVSYQGRSIGNVGLQQTKRALIVRRALKVLCLAIFPAMLNVPAAILVYWISSAVSAVTTNLAISVLMPLRPSPTPCKPGTKSYLVDLTDKVSH